MKVVVDGYIYDSRETPIAVVFNDDTEMNGTAQMLSSQKPAPGRRVFIKGPASTPPLLRQAICAFALHAASATTGRKARVSQFDITRMDTPGLFNFVRRWYNNNFKPSRTTFSRYCQQITAEAQAEYKNHGQVY